MIPHILCAFGSTYEFVWHHLSIEIDEIRCLGVSIHLTGFFSIVNIFTIMEWILATYENNNIHSMTMFEGNMRVLDPKRKLIRYVEGNSLNLLEVVANAFYSRNQWIKFLLYISNYSLFIIYLAIAKISLIILFTANAYCIIKWCR